MLTLSRILRQQGKWVKENGKFASVSVQSKRVFLPHESAKNKHCDRWDVARRATWKERHCVVVIQKTCDCKRVECRRVAQPDKPPCIFDDWQLLLILVKNASSSLNVDVSHPCIVQYVQYKCHFMKGWDVPLRSDFNRFTTSFLFGYQSRCGGKKKEKASPQRTKWADRPNKMDFLVIKIKQDRKKWRPSIHKKACSRTSGTTARRNQGTITWWPKYRRQRNRYYKY